MYTCSLQWRGRSRQIGEEVHHWGLLGRILSVASLHKRQLYDKKDLITLHLGPITIHSKSKPAAIHRSAYAFPK